MSYVEVITPSIASRAALLKEACASVAVQTFKNIRHLVKIDHEKIGPGFVRNCLVKQTAPDTEWLVFLDDDDLLDPCFVEAHLEHQKSTGADLVYSLCRYPPGSGSRPEIIAFDEKSLRYQNYLPVTVLLRRTLFTKVGGFAVTMPYEDWWLWQALMDAGARFSFLDRVCWTYRLHGNAWKPTSGME